MQGGVGFHDLVGRYAVPEGGVVVVVSPQYVPIEDERNQWLQHLSTATATVAVTVTTFVTATATIIIACVDIVTIVNVGACAVAVCVISCSDCSRSGGGVFVVWHRSMKVKSCAR